MLIESGFARKVNHASDVRGGPYADLLLLQRLHSSDDSHVGTMTFYLIECLIDHLMIEMFDHLMVEMFDHLVIEIFDHLMIDMSISVSWERVA